MAKKVNVYVVTCQTCGWTAGEFHARAAARKWATCHRETRDGRLFDTRSHNVVIEKRSER